MHVNPYRTLPQFHSICPSDDDSFDGTDNNPPVNSDTKVCISDNDIPHSIFEGCHPNELNKPIEKNELESPVMKFNRTLPQFRSIYPSDDDSFDDINDKPPFNSDEIDYSSDSDIPDSIFKECHPNEFNKQIEKNEPESPVGKFNRTLPQFRSICPSDDDSY